MHERGHQIMAIVTAAGILLAGGAMFAFPPYKERHAIGAEIADLETRIQDLDGLTEEVQVLAEGYTDLRGGLEQDLKAIPGRPGVSEIMRKLSLPVDGMTVLDQTFTAGGAGDALAVETRTAMRTATPAVIRARDAVRNSPTTSPSTTRSMTTIRIRRACTSPT